MAAPMTGAMRVPWVLLGALSLCGTSPAQPEPGSPEVQRSLEPERDERGWLRGNGQTSAEALMAPREAQVLVLPSEVARRIRRRTVIVYLSAKCPHCIGVVPELLALQRRVADVADFLFVMSSRTDAGQMESFVLEHRINVPVMRDADHSFADATGLRSTPSVLVAEPPSEAEPDSVPVIDAYLPYSQGADRILEMRLSGEYEQVLARGDWLGAYTCAACHPEEARSWSMSAHAVAYFRVTERGGADNLSCLACHVTNLIEGPVSAGADFAPGFRPGSHRSPFADVSCESCHTASGPHDGQGGEPQAACIRCHAPDYVPFQLDRALPLIDHYAGASVSDEDLERQRMAMALGQAPRPLTEPPAGATVGVKACASCHKAQARQWRKSAHRQAMKTLEGEGAQDLREEAERDPECLGCHATPLQVRAEAEAEAEVGIAYRQEEGVGCESCHGPGGAHAADPQHAPIRSLRSRSPECFVEAVCQRCHTENWDPGWDLHERLPLVSH